MSIKDFYKKAEFKKDVYVRNPEKEKKSGKKDDVKKEDEKKEDVENADLDNLFSSVLQETIEEKKVKEQEHIKQLKLLEEEERKRMVSKQATGEETSYGTEKDSIHCAFYLKTGACRYGDTCSKCHPYPTGSTTIIIKNMYDGLGMSDVADEDNDDDLEYDEEEILAHFYQFFSDVVPVFENYGKIIYVHVCRNHSPHLRGNVYVQFDTERDALNALKGLSGRYYAQKQISAEFSPVINWKSAVCGLFKKRTCQRGKLCNFLHVFANPNGLYEGNLGWRNRDESRSPRKRSPSPKRKSRSPQRSSRNFRKKSRSRSRKRRHSRGRDRRSKSPQRRTNKRSRSPKRSRSSSRKRHRTDSSRV